MQAGYTFAHQPNAVASVVLGKSAWAVLALICHIELFVQRHYRESISKDENISELWKDVFLFHWKEESQHAILDELEWIREDAKLTPGARDRAVTELIELVGAVDGILQAQADADAAYFAKTCGRTLTAAETAQLKDGVLKAYRWQYIVSGVQEPHFAKTLGSLIDATQSERIGTALAPILRHVNTH